MQMTIDLSDKQTEQFPATCKIFIDSPSRVSARYD